MPVDPVSHPLADCMDRLRHCLRQGDYAALPALSQQIETLLLDLPRIDRAALARLKAQADSTGACLLAARNGLRAARRRIDELRAGSQALGTYDRSGSRAPLSGEAPAARRL